MKTIISTLLLITSITLSAVTSSQVDAQKKAWKESVNHESSQNYKAAIKSTLEYASSKGDPYLARVRLGWLYYSDKDYKNALTHYKMAAKESRGSVSPLLGLLNTYGAMGETEDQIKICKSILALDKTNYTALINLGALSFTTKNYQTCKTVYAILLTAYPEDLAAISGYAWSLVYLGDNSKALPYFTKLVVMSPDYSFAQKGYELCGGK